jgi:very-short-patch-repair endonuclease
VRGDQESSIKRNNIDKCRNLRKSQTEAEKKLWAILCNRQLAGAKFRRQFSIGKYILDFYSPEYRLGIEADGGQHFEDGGRRKDKARARELSELGVELLRFDDREILNHFNGVYELIEKAIERRRFSPSPSSSPQWGEE